MPASRHLFFKASCPTPPWPRAASDDDDGASAAPLPAPLPGGAGGEVLEMMAKNRCAEGGIREDFVIWKLEKLLYCGSVILLIYYFVSKRTCRYSRVENMV